MADQLLGHLVVRAIPPEIKSLVDAKIYRLHGGVIRDQQGRIVRHLLPVSNQLTSVTAMPFPPIFQTPNILQAYQTRRVKHVADSTRQLLEVSNATMLLSGLNLTVSAMGFAALSQKFDSLDAHLQQIGADVREIRALLERQERAKLLNALNNLMLIESVTNPDHRLKILDDARQDFTQLHFQYRELLEGATEPEQATVYEEYFSLTALAVVRCMAELNMVGAAYQNLIEFGNFWIAQAQRIARELLLGDQPERFLARDLSEGVPTAALIEWMDFAYAEPRGIGWIDELRAQNRPWYPERSINMPSWSRGNALEREREWVIPAMHKVVARHKVYDTHIAQYALMAEYDTTPSQLARDVTALADHAAVDGYLILEPGDQMETGRSWWRR